MTGFCRIKTTESFYLQQLPANSHPAAHLNWTGFKFAGKDVHRQVTMQGRSHRKALREMCSVFTRRCNKSVVLANRKESSERVKRNKRVPNFVLNLSTQVNMSSVSLLLADKTLLSVRLRTEWKHLGKSINGMQEPNTNRRWVLHLILQDKQ